MRVDTIDKIISHGVLVAIYGMVGRRSTSINELGEEMRPVKNIEVIVSPMHAISYICRLMYMPNELSILG